MGLQSGKDRPQRCLIAMLRYSSGIRWHLDERLFVGGSCEVIKVIKVIEVIKVIKVIEKNRKSFSIFGNSGEILVSVFHVRCF